MFKNVKIMTVKMRANFVTKCRDNL